MGNVSSDNDTSWAEGDERNENTRYIEIKGLGPSETDKRHLSSLSEPTNSSPDVMPYVLCVPRLEYHPYRDFRFKKFLFKGDWSTVYKCFPLSNPTKRVAIKEIQLKHLKKQQLMDMHLEMNILSQLHHPSIVEIQSVYSLSSKIFIVMEYLRGGELLTAICQRRKYHESDVRHIMQQVTSGLQYLHSKGIIHRDIKPLNLMLAQRCSSSDSLQSVSVKIVDFGFATLETEGTISGGHLLCGTLGYVAPEALDRRSYSCSADIWSLGCVLYLLLSGSLPFTMDKKGCRAALQGDFDFPSQRFQPVSPLAIDLIQRMLVVDVDSRYTAEDILTHPWMTMTTGSIAANATGDSSKGKVVSVSGRSKSTDSIDSDDSSRHSSFSHINNSTRQSCSQRDSSPTQSSQKLDPHVHYLQPNICLQKTRAQSLLGEDSPLAMASDSPRNVAAPSDQRIASLRRPSNQLDSPVQWSMGSPSSPAALTASSLAPLSSLRQVSIQQMPSPDVLYSHWCRLHPDSAARDHDLTSNLVRMRAYAAEEVHSPGPRRLLQHLYRSVRSWRDAHYLDTSLQQEYDQHTQYQAQVQALLERKNVRTNSTSGAGSTKEGSENQTENLRRHMQRQRSSSSTITVSSTASGQQHNQPHPQPSKGHRVTFSETLICDSHAPASNPTMFAVASKATSVSRSSQRLSSTSMSPPSSHPASSPAGAVVINSRVERRLSRSTSSHLSS